MWRYSGDWMVIWDDRILEILFIEGTGTPTEVAKKEGITVGRSHITKRLSKLTDRGLCENLGNGVYCLDVEGVGYLLGQFDVQNKEWIGLSDERVTFSPSQKLASRWVFMPNYADMYKTHVETIEQKVSQKARTEVLEGSVNVGQKEPQSGKTSTENVEGEANTVTDTSESDSTTIITVPLGDDEPADWMVREAIEADGMEKAKEYFPDYDFSQLDLSEDSK